MVGTPCVTVRRNTERQITVEIGSNRLVSASRDEVLSAVVDSLAAHSEWKVPERWDDGVAARVVEVLQRGIRPLSH